ncbi:MAG: hypothetical protein GY754_39980 [bacterium]|nr:hypothetical protein [bacterium]
MTLITEDHINNALEKLEQSDENPFDGIIEAMDLEQQPLVNYLYEAEGDETSDEERDLLIFCGAIAWYIFNETTGCKNKIENESLDSQLDKNIELFEKMEELDEDSADDMMDILTKYNNQPELMDFILGFAGDGQQANSDTVREDILLVIILHVKTVIDCLVLSEENSSKLQN